MGKSLDIQHSSGQGGVAKAIPLARQRFRLLSNRTADRIELPIDPVLVKRQVVRSGLKAYSFFRETINERQPGRPDESANSSLSDRNKRKTSAIHQSSGGFAHKMPLAQIIGRLHE